jgi:hypothetical protein
VVSFLRTYTRKTSNPPDGRTSRNVPLVHSQQTAQI